MNVTELARKLKVPTKQLLEMLPAMGFDIGRRAIKIDNRVAQKIIANWDAYLKKIKAKDESLESEELKTKKIEKYVLKIPPYIAVKDFALKAGLPVSKVLLQLMKNGVLSSINEKVDFDSLAIIGSDLGLDVVLDEKATLEIPEPKELKKESGIRDAAIKKKSRPPVIVVLGHVDHGKTKLLDTIRKTNVAEGEAGGITQHIGAYQIEKNNRLITFIDTPGHEAFSMMRSRGARIADIAILVVAADDGPKPQTLECIKIIKSVGIPMVVAINKIDKPEANIQKVKQELAQLNLIPEDWGGSTICIPVSAKLGQGIDVLLETLLLVADMNKENIVASTDVPAAGTIIESHIDKGEGPVATVLVQNGILKPGDLLVVGGNYYGKVRALKDFKNKIVSAAPPSSPVKILGLKALPSTGDIIETPLSMDNIKKIKKSTLRTQAASSYSVLPKDAKDEAIVYLNIILKADVLGSLEAIISSLDKLQHPEVRVRVISKGVGNITESDVLLAESQKACIFGFHVGLTPTAQNISQEKGIEIKTYKIIYELLDEVKKRLEAHLSPEIIRTVYGKLKVLAVFRKEKKSSIIGGKVIEGRIVSGGILNVWRNQEVITQGSLDELQLNKIKVDEVIEGQDCGIRFLGPALIEVGDVLECYTEEKRKKKIE